MSNPHNLKVGQTVWLSADKEATIKSIGAKYFYLIGFQCRGSKFSLETLREVDSIYTPKQCHLSNDKLIEEQERNKLLQRIQQHFSHWNGKPTSLDQLRRIGAILNETEKPTQP